jgi:hypothetical protein
MVNLRFSDRRTWEYSNGPPMTNVVSGYFALLLNSDFPNPWPRPRCDFALRIGDSCSKCPWSAAKPVPGKVDATDERLPCQIGFRSQTPIAEEVRIGKIAASRRRSSCSRRAPSCRRRSLRIRPRPPRFTTRRRPKPCHSTRSPETKHSDHPRPFVVLTLQTHACSIDPPALARHETPRYPAFD